MPPKTEINIVPSWKEVSIKSKRMKVLVLPRTIDTYLEINEVNMAIFMVFPYLLNKICVVDNEFGKHNVSCLIYRNVLQIFNVI